MKKLWTRHVAKEEWWEAHLMQLQRARSSPKTKCRRQPRKVEECVTARTKDSSKVCGNMTKDVAVKHEEIESLKIQLDNVTRQHKIERSKLETTSKSMAEMEMSMNQKVRDLATALEDTRKQLEQSRHRSNGDSEQEVQGSPSMNHEEAQ